MWLFSLNSKATLPDYIFVALDKSLVVKWISMLSVSNKKEPDYGYQTKDFQSGPDIVGNHFFALIVNFENKSPLIIIKRCKKLLQRKIQRSYFLRLT